MEKLTFAELEKLEKSYLLVRTPKMKTVLKVQAEIFKGIRDYLDSEGFTELLPPIIGPVTDPGIRGAKQVTIDFYGREYKVMSSAILYKQMMATALGKIYFFSPNVRLEPPETAYTGRHLVEFVQVDVEEAYVDYYGAMRTAERLLAHTLGYVKDTCSRQLEELGRDLKVYKPPYPKLTYSEALEILAKNGHYIKYGAEIPWEAEELLSKLMPEPFFIMEYPKGSRGFYDMEDPARPGILRDFDLLYPEGYGEAVSGAEREYTYEKVIERMYENGEDPAKYGWYLEMLREGIVPTSGFGIGVERLTRFICGLRTVWEARPYPKVAGIYSP